MRPLSVRLRLTAWYTLVLAVSFTAIAVGAWWVMRNSIHDTVDKDLRQRLQAMRQYLEKQAADPDSGPLAEELAEQGGLAPAGTRYRIAGPERRWIYSSPGSVEWDPDVPDPSKLPAKGAIRTMRAPDGPVRVISGAVPSGVVEIGIALDEFYDMLDDFKWAAIFATPLALLIAAIGGYWMSRRALEPVERISRAAAEIEARNLSQRLPVRGSGDELDRLSVTLNFMFARLEASFERMTRFTADASHELRTPVAIIRTTAELARSKPRTEEEYAKALDGILTESERTTRLIEDLMLMARADSGSDGIALEPLDLAASLQDALAEAHILADAAGVNLECGRIDHCTVSGDAQALSRLWLILLDNAFKYTSSGGTVTVSVSADKKSGVVEVRDTGIGINPEDLPHIFERFYRSAKDRSRQTGGAGLGLSIAQWIANRHGGEILVESCLGSGSSFRVRLPIIFVSSPLLQNSPPQ